MNWATITIGVTTIIVQRDATNISGFCCAPGVVGFGGIFVGPLGSGACSASIYSFAPSVKVNAIGRFGNIPFRCQGVVDMYIVGQVEIEINRRVAGIQRR